MNLTYTYLRAPTLALVSGSFGHTRPPAAHICLLPRTGPESHTYIMHASEQSSCHPRSAAHASIGRTRFHLHGDAHKANKMNTDAWKCDFAGEKLRKRNAESKCLCSAPWPPVCEVWLGGGFRVCCQEVHDTGSCSQGAWRDQGSFQGTATAGLSGGPQPAWPAAAAHKDRGVARGKGNQVISV